MTDRELDMQLPEDVPAIITRRWVDAKPRLVFEAWTKPELLKRWWGPHYMTLTECAVDLRVGGEHTYVNVNTEGDVFRFRGIFREIEPGIKLVSDWTFEGMPNDPALNTVEFFEQAGGTMIVSSSIQASFEAREAQSASGRMYQGMLETYERLDSLLAEFQSS